MAIASEWSCTTDLSGWRSSSPWRSSAVWSSRSTTCSGREEVEHVLQDSGATWVVYEQALASTLQNSSGAASARRFIQVDDGDGVGAAHEAFEVVVASGSCAEFVPDGYCVVSDDLLLLQYTSGTTGVPKGAMHTHSTVLWNSIHQVIDFGITSDEVFVVVPALCWAAGLHDLALATLWCGGRIVLSPSTGFTPQRFLETLDVEGVTAAFLVPTVLKRVLADPTFEQHDLSRLRIICSGGEPVPITSIDDLHTKLPTCSLLQCYGMSEFPTMMLIVEARDARRKIGSTGRACSAAEVRVVTSRGADVAPGEVGEIICRSPANMLGYYGNDDATSSTIVDGWLHTGDLATVDDEGFVFVSGRSKDMIISGGLNVYPAEIERVISQHPAVAEAAVIGLPDETWGEVGVGIVVLTEALSETELAEYLRQELATYKVPRELHFRDSPLPRTTSGKVQKFKLRELVDLDHRP